MSKKTKAGKAGVLALGTALVGAGVNTLSAGNLYGGGGLILVGLALFAGYELVQDKQIRDYADQFAGAFDEDEVVDGVRKTSEQAGETVQKELDEASSK